jgi:branched-chain amino acid aminotransferase
MPPVPENLFLDCVHMAVAKNAEFVPPHDFAGNMYIRPLQFGSSAQIGLDLPDEFTFCVFVQPHPPLHGHAPLTALVAEDFDRAATRGTGNSKVGGNYGPVLKWLREAKKSENGGWGVLLHLDSKTQSYVDEFSTAALIGIVDTKNDEAPTLVVAHSDAVINSITADSVAKIAQSFVWKVKKRLVSRFCFAFAMTDRLT